MYIPLCWLFKEIINHLKLTHKMHSYDTYLRSIDKKIKNYIVNPPDNENISDYAIVLKSCNCNHLS